MRGFMLTILLTATACGDSSSESSSGSSSSSGSGEHCSAGWGDGPEVVADYPACGCAPDRCGEGSACRADGPTPSFTSSICTPVCDSLGKCKPLKDFQPECENGFCVLRCGECPDGYVCASDQTCQVALE